MQEQLKQKINKIYAFILSKIARYVVKYVRLFFIHVIIKILLFHHDYVRPLFSRPYLRRFITSVIHLVSIRIILLLLGYYRIENQKINYFTYRQRNKPYRNYQRLQFNSGYIGLVSYSNIIDFFYFSCLFNPTFVKMIQYFPNKDSKKSEILICPLTFRQAYQAALTYRGFDPIIIKGEEEYKKCKLRKLKLRKFNSQSAHQLDGPVVILLPRICPKSSISLKSQIPLQILYNEQQYGRKSNFFFSSTLQYSEKKQKIPTNFTDKVILNQKDLIHYLCQQTKLYIYNTTFQQISVSYAYRFRNNNVNQNGAYEAMMQSILLKKQKLIKISFEEYLNKKIYDNFIFPSIQQKEDNANKKKKKSHNNYKNKRSHRNKV